MTAAANVTGDLLAATADLVAIPSPSHQETALADHVESLLRGSPWLEVVRLGDNVVASTRLGRSRRLLLAGHLDTVPQAADQEQRLDGDTLWGLGTADMKGGLAVMLALAARPDPALDLTFVFYVAEEVARVHSGLRAVEAARPDLLVADAAILGEPTDVVVEAGCQGVVKARVVVGGRRAHTARPWTGVNAIHRSGALLSALHLRPPRTVTLDGCTYRESLQAVAVGGGVAGNVVPDESEIVLSYRFAPDLTVDAALGALDDILRPHLDVGQGDRWEVLDRAPAALPNLDHPLLRAVEQATGRPPRAKLAWTDVAFFAERGVPALNLGPGDPLLAHTSGEHVERARLDAAYEVLASVVLSR